MPSVACPAKQYFSILFHKRQDFGKTLLNTKCVLISSPKMSETLLISKRTERHLIKNVLWSSSKVPLLLSDCNVTVTVSIISNNTQISVTITTCPVTVQLFHADRWMYGRTDTTKLIVAFRNFAKRTKKLTNRHRKSYKLSTHN